MTDKLYADYFLGANTPRGFCSLFEQSYSPSDGWRVFIIKGGPGTGKSTLMNAVAASAAETGIFTERIHCSSDPASLDAVILPSLRRAIFDGTAPHVLEPTLPGACEQIINLGQTWDSDILYERRDAIADYSRQCIACHRQATRMLACADAFRTRLREPAELAADRSKIHRAAERLCERFGLTHRFSSKGTVAHRLASAVTPDGVVSIADAYLSSYDIVVPLPDRSYAVSGMLLSSLRDLLSERGYNVVECPCSQDFSRVEHLLVPDEGICFTTRNDAHGLDSRTHNDTRAIRAERFLPDELARGRHPSQVANRREMLRFTRHASDCMSQAKAIHDRIEECYSDAMDFSLVEQLGRHVCSDMLG